MKLSHEYSKLGNSVIYQVIYLDTLDFAIEACLGEGGYFGKLHFQLSELLV